MKCPETRNSTQVLAVLMVHTWKRPEGCTPLRTEDWKVQDGEQNNGKGQGQTEIEIMVASQNLEALLQLWGSTLFTHTCMCDSSEPVVILGKKCYWASLLDLCCSFAPDVYFLSNSKAQ